MTLRTKILLTGGLLRYVLCVLILAVTRFHWIGVIVAGFWLLCCRPMLRKVILPALFPHTKCPKCFYRIPLRQFWGCEHYKDHRPRHVLAFHCSKGHEIEHFECPRNDCRSTIQVQKRIDSKLSKGVVLGTSFNLAPGEYRHSWFRRLRHVSRLWKRHSEGVNLPLGFDRQFRLSILHRWIRKACRLPVRKPITVSEEVYSRHMTIFGKSGMGKSEYILSMVKWMLKTGHGGTIIDPAGDLANKIIRHVPENRLEDVLWIRVSDRDCPFRFNILETNDEVEEINLNDELLSALKRMSTSWGEQMAYQIEVGIDTVKAMGGSLKDVYDLFTNQRARDRAIAEVDAPELIEFWERYNRTRESGRAPVIRKLRGIVKHKLLGPMLCADKSNFDPDAIIRERKIVVIDLSTGSTSEKVNIVLGTLIVSKMMAAAFRGKFKKESERIRHFLIVDEAKNFVHRGTNFERIFSEARKYKLSLVLANQHVTQLTEEVRDAAFSNAGVLMSFNVDDDDAKLFDKRMRDVTADDITRQEIGECIVRIHNRTEFVKTELPIAPLDDFTDDIEQRMQELNEATEPVCEEPKDDSHRFFAPGLTSCFAEVCDGVR